MLDPAITNRIIDLKLLLKLVPYSRTHLWRMEKQGDFPQRIRIGKNRIGWWEKEVIAWLNGKSEQRQSSTFDQN